MDKKALEQYLLQSLNMGLGSSIQGETSYTNSFDIKITAEGFIFIPRLPASYIIDDELYQKIFLIHLYIQDIPYSNKIQHFSLLLTPTIFMFSAGSSFHGNLVFLNAL